MQPSVAASPLSSARRPRFLFFAWFFVCLVSFFAQTICSRSQPPKEHDDAAARRAVIMNFTSRRRSVLYRARCVRRRAPEITTPPQRLCPPIKSRCRRVRFLHVSREIFQRHPVPSLLFTQSTATNFLYHFAFCVISQKYAEFWREIQTIGSGEVDGFARVAFFEEEKECRVYFCTRERRRTEVCEPSSRRSR